MINDYTPSDTAVLLVDPYNGFLAEGGNLYPHIKKVATEINLFENLQPIVDVCRHSIFRASSPLLTEIQCHNPINRSLEIKAVHDCVIRTPVSLGAIFIFFVGESNVSNAPGVSVLKMLFSLDGVLEDNIKCRRSI